MRHREMSSAEPAINTLITAQTASGSCTDPWKWTDSPASYIAGSYVPNTFEKKYDDVVVSQFEKRRDHGEIFMNPMVSIVTTVNRNPVFYDEMYSTWKSLLCGTAPNTYYLNTYNTGLHTQGLGSPTRFLPYDAYPSTPAIDSTVVKEIAVTAAWANANQADMLLLEPVAESKETVHSLIKLSKRIIRLAWQVKRSKWRQVWKELAPKQLADRWMEGRYLIRPLVYDIAAVAKIINTRSRPKKLRQTYRGGNSASSTNEAISKCYTRPGGYELYCKYETNRTISARAGVLADVEEIEYISRFGLDLPFETLYELTPFSFVLDWFVNVGKVIGSWTPKLGVTGLASWVTVSDTVVKTKVIDHVVDLYVPNQWTHERWVRISGGRCSTTTTTITRLPSPNRPVLPHVNVRLDLAKLLDLVIMIKKALF